MSLLALMRGRGAEGLPPPEPIDFSTLVPPASPNACLLAPPGDTSTLQKTIALLPVSLDAVWAALRVLGNDVPRCTRIAEWSDLRQAQWVVRSAMAGFPDIVAAQAVALPGGTGVYLYSRSLVGHYDFGVNRARVEAWRARLNAVLRAA